MIKLFANLFGYFLNFIYELVNNYGLAIILFSVILKAVLLPLTIKQQRTLKKSQKLQPQIKMIQEKYKNDPTQQNKEVMELYKREKTSPFSGCLTSIIQLVLLISMFYLVRNPLTFMKKVDADSINKYKEKIEIELGEDSISQTYPEISIVQYINNKIDGIDPKAEENIPEEIIKTGNETIENDITENIESEENENETENVEEEVTKVDEVKEMEINENLYINMNFCGLDLSNIPWENKSKLEVFIIPVLYIISSIISIKLTQESTKNEEMSAQVGKSMVWMMPLLAVSISIFAPLGLALYWLINNVLMIVERILIDKYIIPREEDENG